MGSNQTLAEQAAKVTYGPFAPHLVEDRTAALSALLPTCWAKANVGFGSIVRIQRVRFGHFDGLV
jgi:hypothetical protein